VSVIDYTMKFNSAAKSIILFGNGKTCVFVLTHYAKTNIAVVKKKVIRHINE